jgi:hypothetical protein
VIVQIPIKATIQIQSICRHTMSSSIHATNEIATDTNDPMASWSGRDFSTMTDCDSKKYITYLLNSIDANTADASVLPTLSKLRAHALTTVTKLDTRIRKRDDDAMVKSCYYPMPRTEAELAKIASDEARDKYWLENENPAVQANALERKAESLALNREINEDKKKELLRADERQRKLALWFKTHCSKIDEKVDAITAKIPDYCAPVDSIDIGPPKKKAKPNAGEVQIALAYAFKEPDAADPAVLLSQLNSQLVDSDIAEGKLAKSITARAVKLQSRPVTEVEREQNNGVRKLKWSMHLKDSSEHILAHWFKQHSLAIKTKIATVGQVLE